MDKYYAYNYIQSIENYRLYFAQVRFIYKDAIIYFNFASGSE